MNVVKSKNRAETWSQTLIGQKIGEDMTRFAILFMILTGGIAVGLVVLSNWQIPAPITAIDKVIPNDKLQK
tara:strand:- start:565 stop:777 length:213 start_codon:yes stop_codon:yes gene_type:complete